MELIGIYDAEGGLSGELSYAWGKMLGRNHCELCDITHSLFFQKKKWKELIDKLYITIRVVHLNEQSPALKSVTDGKTPCIVLSCDGNYEIIIDTTDLKNCNGDVCKFENLLFEILPYASA